MRSFPVLLAVSVLTLSSPSFGDPSPLSPPVPQSDAQPQPPLENRHRWELDGAAFKSFSGDNSSRVGALRFLVRRFLNDSLSIGADLRFWPAGSYPLGDDAGSGAWGAGGAGQLYLFRSNYLGAYLGGSLLWVPAGAQADFAPEAGIKWFASRRLALGLTYSLLTDLRSYTISFEPPANGKSRQSLGLELSVYL